MKVKRCVVDVWLNASWGLLVNMSLLSVFMLSHSLLAASSVKKHLGNWGLQDTYRSCYVLVAAVSLLVGLLNCFDTFIIIIFQTITRNWLNISEFSIWKFNLNVKPFWWLYVSIHILAWLVIYVGNICMDINELLGIKQVCIGF